MDKGLKTIIEKLPPQVEQYIDNNGLWQKITEIRTRPGFNIKITAEGKNKIIENTALDSYEIWKLFLSFCDSTLFAYEERIAQGYITLDGGHRVGIAGSFYSDENGKIKINTVTSLNIRIATNKIIDVPLEIENFSKGLLILGPPHSGKTTLLKSLCSKYADKNVSVCDERNELYARHLNCDYISGINKAMAIQMATRSLSPDIIICDEIGSQNEVFEILSGVNSGVKFICTAHCDSISDIYFKPNIKALLDAAVFDKIVLLSFENNRFYIKDIVNV